MRLLLVGLLCACKSSSPPSPRDLAPDPASVSEPDYHNGAPAFARPEERRCPKLPAGDKRWKELSAPRDLERLDEGLLICHVGIATKDDPDHWPWGSWHPPVRTEKDTRVVTGGGDWDTLNGPDTRFRFRFGDREPLELWGPEDHWEMYITLPRVTLTKGDRIRVDVWDRDFSSQEYISGWESSFDGRFPLQLEAKWVRMECRAWTAAEAHQHAAPLLKDVERLLDDAASFSPSLAGDLGPPPQIGRLKDSWFSPNLRYLAGHLGWDAPEVQACLKRLDGIEKDWPAKWKAWLQAEVSKTPAEWTPLDDGLEARLVLASATVEVRRLTADAALPVRDPSAYPPTVYLGRFVVTALDDAGQRGVQVTSLAADRFRIDGLPPGTRALRLWSRDRALLLRPHKGD